MPPSRDLAAEPAADPLQARFLARRPDLTGDRQRHHIEAGRSVGVLDRLRRHSGLLSGFRRREAGIRSLGVIGLRRAVHGAG